MNTEELKTVAREVRYEAVKMIGAGGSGHPGGSLSEADILTALYFKEMKIDPENPQWEERDRFVLSKGHGAPGLYATLAVRGFFDKGILSGLRKLGSPLQGHPDMRKVPGVEMSTGSLGQGFSTAVGMAKSFKISGDSNRVYGLLGDGEVEEGLIWEAAMAASHYHLDNLTAILDNNGLQIDGPCDCVMGVEPLDKKWEAFGFHVIKIDGHDMEAIVRALEEARTIKGKPTLILAKTVKGKGVSFMEDQAGWHGKAPNDDELKRALEELS